MRISVHNIVIGWKSCHQDHSQTELRQNRQYNKNFTTLINTSETINNWSEYNNKHFRYKIMSTSDRTITKPNTTTVDSQIFPTIIVYILSQSW